MQEGSFRVLITGSRYWGEELFLGSNLVTGWASAESPRRDAMVLALRHARVLSDGRPIVVVHGGARGADLLAAAIAAASGVTTELHEAHWQNPDGTRNRAAGIRRNERMVAAGANVCLAFFHSGQENRGTSHCARIAESAGIPVVRTTV